MGNFRSASRVMASSGDAITDAYTSHVSVPIPVNVVESEDGILFGRRIVRVSKTDSLMMDGGASM
jgi:hypothetical protein